MKRTIQKTVVLILVTLLTASFVAILPILPAHSQPEEPRRFSVSQGENTWIVEPIHGTVSAEEFYDYVPETLYVYPSAYLDIAPNPIGVGQPLGISAWIEPLPPGENYLSGVTLEIRNPDGEYDIIGPLENFWGWSYFTYTPTTLGNYTFQLSYDGDTFEENAYEYWYTLSDLYIVTVQADNVSLPSPPSPPFIESAPSPIGSGHTPYMEYRKSKIYLYEDTTTGELSLIIHHNEELTEGSVRFGMNMSVNDLPSGAYIALSDDVNEFGWPMGWENPDWVFGGWLDVYRSDSEGAVISGLPADEEWTISVYAGAVGAIDAWEFQTTTYEGSIPLELLMYGEPGPIVPLYISAELPEEVGVQVINEVVGVPPDAPWNYVITELPFNNTVANFTLPAGGGNMSFPELTGGVYLINQTSKHYYPTTITLSEGATGNIIADSALVSIPPLGSVTVTFTNSLYGGFTLGSVGELPSVDLGYSIPINKPIPVQATWNTDINNDGKIDLVLGKPTAILVNLTDADITQSSQLVTVKVTFEGTVYTNFTTGTKILGDSIVSIWDKPIIPPSTPKPVASNDKITGYYKIDNGAQKPLEDTNITVKDTSGLLLTYLNLTRSNYGAESSAAYNQMVGNTTAFTNATYPTIITEVKAGTSIAGAPKATTAQAKKDPYYALKIDCTTAANARYLGSGIGVAIGPNASGSMDYFTYHGFPGAAGFTANPSTKGVIVLDGYYTAGAHEVGHIYGLNWGAGNEEYNTNPNKIGNTASGVWAANGQWIKGYNFMGLAEYGKVQSTWVNQSTYQNLFNQMKTTSDPEILLANGLIYKNGTVEFLQTWYHLPQGTPDTLISGDYALRFVNATGYVLSTTSFDASFFVQIDPGVSVGQNEIDLSAFGTKETDSATFAFAAEYPAGTSAVQVVNMTNPQNPVVMATVNAANIINYFSGFLPPINNDGSSVFKLGSTVPVKFQLKDMQGNFISTAIANIYMAKISNNVIGTDVEAASTSAATTGNLFRYDPDGKQYIFNLSTKPLSKGTWQIKVVINDGTTRTVLISLR